MKDNSAIRKLLFDGPCSISSVKPTAEHSRLADALVEVEDEINGKFGGEKEIMDLFEKYNKALDDLCFEETCLCFETGVKFGVLFGMELNKD